jgi:hypothetical protein
MCGLQSLLSGDGIVFFDVPGDSGCACDGCNGLCGMYGGGEVASSSLLVSFPEEGEEEKDEEDEVEE